ncbi:hypothetical protein ACLBXM_15785 [Xanthobacteraceae bacterium A53D]
MAYACEKYVDPKQHMCGATHCTALADTSEDTAWCKCIDWQGRPIPDCQPKGSTVPIKTFSCYNQSNGEQRNISEDACQDLRDQNRNWKWTACYCCCSCFAWNTKIRVPSANADTEVRFIQDIEVQDQVLAAWIEPRDDGTVGVTWKPREVSFSDGTSPSSVPQSMIVVQYGAEGELTATPDQLFLMPDGKLKEAKRLTAGDYLIDDEGQPVVVHGVYLGNYNGGIQHLGVGPAPEDTHVPVSGNLFSANGIIVGDFWLQVTYSSETHSEALAEGHAELPQIGSAAYAKATEEAVGTEGDLFSAQLTGHAPRAIRSASFEGYQARDGKHIPAGASRYITREQARALALAPHHPASMDYNRADYLWLQKLFRAFFPEVSLHLEWSDEVPNLYAFEQFGQKTVYISGRLLRIEGMYWQGIATILSHGISMFYAGKQPDGSYPCIALADNFGVGYVLRTALDPNWGDAVNEGYAQLRALFDHIPEDLRPGDPDNLCGHPAIECRLQSVQAAIIGRPMPACSGVPRKGRLELRRSTYAVIEGTPSLKVSFSEAVGPSAEDVSHYTITPETVITTVLRDPEDPSLVILTVTLAMPPADEYRLDVSDILAADGSTLSALARTAYFTVTPGGQP